MRIKPNKTIVEGRVRRLDPAPDGWGADLEVVVEDSRAARDFEDFIQAKPGSVVTIFVAEPERIRVGGRYSLTTSVLGGPNGQRLVVQDARPAPSD